MGRSDSLSANPLEAARKKAKQRQLQKNKEQRTQQRQQHRQHQSASELHAELVKLRQRQSQLELQHQHDSSVNVNSGHIKEQITQLQTAYDAALKREREEKQSQRDRTVDHVTVRGVGGLASVFGDDEEQRAQSSKTDHRQLRNADAMHAHTADDKPVAIAQRPQPIIHPYEDILAVPPGLDKPPVPLHLRKQAAVNSQQPRRPQQVAPPPPPPPQPYLSSYQHQNDPHPPQFKYTNEAPHHERHNAPSHYAQSPAHGPPISHTHAPPHHAPPVHYRPPPSMPPHLQQRHINIQPRSQHRRRDADLNDPLNTANPNYTAAQRATIDTLGGRQQLPPPPQSPLPQPQRQQQAQPPTSAAERSEPHRRLQTSAPAAPAPGLGIASLQKVNPSALAATRLTPTNIAVKRTQHPTANEQYAPQLLRKKFAAINAAPDV